MNTIYKKLLNNKINQFIEDFKSSRDVFENITKKNKLLHPGEFGMFRENICDELIKFTIPGKFRTATGFLLNSFDKVSTQCDLIIYDFNNTPLIHDSSNVRFFPVESVIAIGEIKSKLTINQLCKALLVLAKNKMIKEINNKRTMLVNDTNSSSFDPKINCYDTLFSFLICEEIKSFNFEKLNAQVEKVYSDNNIPYHFRHNIILSLKNGVISYSTGSENSKLIYFPTILGQKFNNYHLNENPVSNVSNFLTSISNFVMVARVYYPEPNIYNY